VISFIRIIPVFNQCPRQGEEKIWIIHWKLVCLYSSPFETKVNFSFRTISTPFIYQPRSRPAHPIPAPLDCGKARFLARPGWKMYSSVARARPNEIGIQDIAVKFYIPGTRSQNLSRVMFYVFIDTRHQSPEYSGLGKPSRSTSPLRALGILSRGSGPTVPRES
jgi:hypothetical protein